MKCMDCPDYKACRRQNDLRRKRHKCKKANEPFVQTNADRIRAMSDEELCEFLGQYSFFEMCDEGCDACAYKGDCEKRLLEWLQEPVKDGDNE